MSIKFADDRIVLGDPETKAESESDGPMKSRCEEERRS